MANGPTTTDSLKDALQRLYSRDLLMRMLPELVFAEFALKSPLPAKAGATTIRLFRFDRPTTLNVQKVPLAPTVATPGEGIPMTSAKFRALKLEYVDADLSQYIQTIAITDVADATSLFDLVGQANMQNAEDAALFCDSQVQFELARTANPTAPANGNVDYTKKLFVYANKSADYAAVQAATGSAGILTATDLLDAATALKVNMAPKVNGGYVMAAPPQVTRDIMAGANTNTTWLNAAQYSAVTQLFNGEVGKLWGIRIIEHNNAYISAAAAPGANPEANYNPIGNVFSAFMFGRQAYGIPSLNALGSPYAPAVFVVTGADKSDPANQIRALVSWKAFWAAKLLQPAWLVHLFTQSGSAARLLPPI